MHLFLFIYLFIPFYFIFIYFFPELLQFDCNDLGLGLYSDPSSCNHFYICVPAEGGGYTPIKMDCPIGTRFDKGLKICNHAHEIECW